MGSTLLSEIQYKANGTRIRTLKFCYDEKGSPIGFVHIDASGADSFYYYAKNLQGDVVALYQWNWSNEGNHTVTLVATYNYDPWGKLLSVKNASGSTISSTLTAHIANVNPFRYRGYYYDAETGFYYLRSRYYDPAISRFINADSYATTGQGFLGANMFAYCNNNPVLFFDPFGHSIYLSSSATEDEIEQYERAVGYLKTSEDGAALIERLEDSTVIFTIVFIDETDERGMRYNTSHTIYFDPYFGLVIGDGTSVMSAALCLAHEMGHAAQHLDGELYGERLDIEQANVDKYETPIAKQLGEPVRGDYKNTKGGMRMNNSTHHRTTYNRPWWHYIAPWNWGKPNQVVTNHSEW